MTKTYFFSGSFDPPHLGHREIARISRQFCDHLIIFPTHQSPAKKNSQFSKDADRLEMSKLNFSDIPGISIDDYELTSTAINYTINTIYYLKDKFPEDELTLIIGKDQWYNFRNWFRWQVILQTVNILCFNRDIISAKKENFHQYPNVRFYTDFHNQISSNEIRSLFRRKDDRVQKYLYRDVYSYILERGLYQ